MDAIDNRLELLAEEVLRTIEFVSNRARAELGNRGIGDAGMLTGTAAQQLSTIQAAIERELRKLVTEPSIARVGVVWEHRGRHIAETIWIHRGGTPSGVAAHGLKLAHIHAALGRVAEFAAGEWGEVQRPNAPHEFRIAAKAQFSPTLSERLWDALEIRADWGMAPRGI